MPTMFHPFTVAFTDAATNVAASQARRVEEAARVPEVWAMAERLSRSGHSAPRAASTIYRELIAAYELGKRHATDAP